MKKKSRRLKIKNRKTNSIANIVTKILQYKNY